MKRQVFEILKVQEHRENAAKAANIRGVEAARTWPKQLMFEVKSPIEG
jgi:hypothetical protein